MKLLQFDVITPVGRFRRLGALLPGETAVLDLNSAYQAQLEQQGRLNATALAQVLMPPTMRGLIEAGRESWTLAQELIKTTAQDPAATTNNGARLVFALNEISIVCPLENPNSLRDFITFEAHIKRGYTIRNKPFPEEWYARRVYYKGNHRTVIGPEDAVNWPSYTQKLDYELEYACVIGTPGKNLTEAQAAEHIFGYTILNDFSARDIQFKEMTCRLGPAKGKDFATAIGPYIVTPDEIPDIRDLTMQAYVNGELWSEGNSGTSHWTWPQMIAYLSQEEQLHPTDVLGSGTVGGGCGYELDKWIQPGDEVTLKVTNLGLLTNKIK